MRQESEVRPCRPRRYPAFPWLPPAAALPLAAPAHPCCTPPYQVTSLLEKLPPDTIQLDPTRINTVDVNPRERQKEMQAARAARLAEVQAGKKTKNKTRGRSKIGKREKKKQVNILDEKRKRRLEQLEKEQQKKRAKKEGKPAAPAYDPLDRFVPKKIKKKGRG